jgi:hypothetical protein
MSLRGRVGRHGVGGRQCQNWVDDQQQVIDLLNSIPVAQGGAGGQLGGRIVLGIASQALNLAIARFEDRYFPGQRSGFVDPGAKMWKRMASVMAASNPQEYLIFRMDTVFIPSVGYDYGDPTSR